MRIKNLVAQLGVMDFQIHELEKEVGTKVNAELKRMKKQCKDLGIKVLEFGHEVSPDEDMYWTNYYSWIEINDEDLNLYRLVD